MTTTNNTIEPVHTNEVAQPELFNGEKSNHNTEQVSENNNSDLIVENTIYAEPIANFGPFTITNSLLSGWVVVLLLIALGYFLRKSLKEVPKGFQNIFEILIEGTLNIADQVTGDRKLTLKLFPIVITVFIFVLANNWFGILPGVGSLGQIQIHNGERFFVPLFRGANADINTTLALSILSVIGANVFGIISIGVWKTFNKFINIQVLSRVFTDFKKDPTIIIVAPITFFVGLIEIVGEIAKIASLSFRLFGNVFAGEVLLASMSALVSIGIPIPFLFLELFVGAIQAFIFAMLTLVYFTIASYDHDEEHAKEGEHLEEFTELIEEDLELTT